MRACDKCTRAILITPLIKASLKNYDVTLARFCEEQASRGHPAL